MARQYKLARFIKMLVANVGSRDNGPDNNFLHVPWTCQVASSNKSLALMSKSRNGAKATKKRHPP